MTNRDTKMDRIFEKIHKIQYADLTRDSLSKIENNDDTSKKAKPEHSSAIQNNSAS